MKIKKLGWNNEVYYEDVSLSDWIDEYKGWFTLLIILFVLFVMVGLILAACFTSIHYIKSRGEHTGIVTASENYGIFFKTNRVYFKTDTTSSQEDTYCVIDNEVYNRLRDLQTSKEKVTIYYIDYLWVSIKECGSYNGGIIIDVK